MRLRGRKREASDLDLTPLIDVVFILLIFVVLAASFERLRELPVSLPQVSAARPRVTLAEIRIFVPVQGNLTLNERALAEEELPAALESLSSKKSHVRLFVDAGARFERAVQVLDVIRSAGFEDVGVVARRGAP